MHVSFHNPTSAEYRLPHGLTEPTKTHVGWLTIAEARGAHLSLHIDSAAEAKLIMDAATAAFTALTKMEKQK